MRYSSFSPVHSKIRRNKSAWGVVSSLEKQGMAYRCQPPPTITQPSSFSPSYCHMFVMCLLVSEIHKLRTNGGLPWMSRGYDSTLSLLRTQVQSLVEELRSHKPRDMAKKKKKKEPLG